MKEQLELLSKYSGKTIEEIETLFIGNPSLLSASVLGVNVFEELKTQINKNQVLKELIVYINDNYSVGDKLAPDRNVAEALGYERSTIREYYPHLKLFGYLDVHHGKSTVFKRSFEKHIIELVKS
ncbi:GntR family transcriptional regulator [Pseudoalteromonas sp. MEBiC 03485]|uniref:GntR family transcriptional regulator n=1 Tax=Pseudoalteromonas sp. MEBiC 03485 TaxID=2571103 RepID=UPI0010222C0B|nr:GntR family transcriptional regulator [Pseudoalteromonas sp. MEBiC 03485]RZD19683.1 GntR family transcriptional regulator [Pseudoalteromonas sp. MEBiC 03485]